jgi:hypothetical protein
LKYIKYLNKNWRLPENFQQELIMILSNKLLRRNLLMILNNLNFKQQPSGSRPFLLRKNYSKQSNDTARMANWDSRNSKHFFYLLVKHINLSFRSFSSPSTSLLLLYLACTASLTASHYVFSDLSINTYYKKSEGIQTGTSENEIYYFFGIYLCLEVQQWLKKMNLSFLHFCLPLLKLFHIIKFAHFPSFILYISFTYIHSFLRAFAATFFYSV